MTRRKLGEDEGETTKSPLKKGFSVLYHRFLSATPTGSHVKFKIHLQKHTHNDARMAKVKNAWGQNRKWEVSKLKK